MRLTYHPSVQTDIDRALRYYSEISDKLADHFWDELIIALEYARDFPERHHFDSSASGKRRSNLGRFPYHFLFEELGDRVRMVVLRFDGQDPKFGLRRDSPVGFFLSKVLRASEIARNVADWQLSWVACEIYPASFFGTLCE